MEEIIFKVSADTGNVSTNVKRADAVMTELNTSYGKVIDSTKELTTAQSQGDKGTSTLETRMKALTDKLSQGGLTMRDYSQTIKQYQAIALEAGRASPIGQQALTEAAHLQDKIGDLRNEVTNLANDQKNLQGVIGVASTVTAGYGAVQGAMALMGVESESLQKTFVKLQAAQSLLNGLNAISTALQKESATMILLTSVRTKALIAVKAAYAVVTGTATGATMALNVAMLLNPAVLIVVAIAALVAGLMLFNSSSNTAKEENDKLTASMERQSEAFDRNSSRLKQNTQNKIDLAVSEGASEAELFEMRKKQMGENEALRKFQLMDERKNINSLQEQYKLALSEDNNELAKSIKAQLNVTKGKYRDLKDMDGQFFNDMKIAKNNEDTRILKEDDAADKDAEAKRKTASDKAKQNADKRRAEQEKADQLKIEQANLIQDLLDENIADADLRAFTQLQTSHRREREEMVKKFGADAILEAQLATNQANEKLKLEADIDARILAESKATTDLEDEQKKAALTIKNTSRKAELESEILSMRSDFAAVQSVKAELALFDMQVALEQENLTAGEKLLIKEQFDEKIRAINQETADKEKQLQQESFDASIDFAQRGANAIGEISDVVFSIKNNNLKKGSVEELRAAKNQFRITKALQLAQAGIDARKAINATLAVSPLTNAGVPNPGAIKALVFTAITSAANIAKIAATRFTGGGGDGGGGGGAPSVTPPSIPSPTEVSGGQTGDVPSTLTNGQSNIKVNVVDSDIKASLANSERVNVTSSIG